MLYALIDALIAAVCHIPAYEKRKSCLLQGALDYEAFASKLTDIGLEDGHDESKFLTAFVFSGAFQLFFNP